MPTILITRLPHGEGLPLPTRATEGSSGFDVASAESGELVPGGRRLFATGFAVAIPPGYEIQIRPRSGLALKHGVTLPNTPATIDSDYRGELKIALINLGTEPYQVTRGMRIAQLIVSRVEPADFRLVSTLPLSVRGEGGFGSTGIDS
ncbi:MAG TPA: dUTP diphosphatase [Gemmatimonadales bacterium]|jgi:dUTP pyrophosphatase|nr:dUTP diphosphatase [Gemmatimonadales bacterium]